MFKIQFSGLSNCFFLLFKTDLQKLVYAIISSVTKEIFWWFPWEEKSRWWLHWFPLHLAYCLSNLRKFLVITIVCNYVFVDLFLVRQWTCKSKCKNQIFISFFFSLGQVFVCECELYGFSQVVSCIFVCKFLLATHGEHLV